MGVGVGVCCVHALARALTCLVTILDFHWLDHTLQQ